MTPKKIDYPASAPRVETGVVQFGDDWPGVFIRGDHAFAMARALRVILDRIHIPENEKELAEYSIDHAECIGLLNLLRDCDARNHVQIPPEMNPVRSDP